MHERDADKWASEAELIEGMRRRDEGALRAFFLRFYPCLVERACRLGLSTSESDECVTELLDDVAILIIDRKHRVREQMAGYLLRAVRNRVANLRRDASRRAHLHERSSDDSGVNAASGAASVSMTPDASEDSEFDAPAASPALERLAVELHRNLPPEDRVLLEWLVYRASASTIGEHFGITRQAAKQRIRRLRLRLVETARRHARSSDDREELLRFFRRAGALAALLPAKSSAGMIQTVVSHSENAASAYASSDGDAA